EKNHHTSLCFSWRRIVDVNDNVLTNFYISHFWPVIKYRIQARRHSYAHGMVMFRTDHIKKIGLYDESKYRAQDYFLWKKAVDNGYRIGVIRKILYNERFRLSITHKTELDYYLRLHNLYFRAQNRKMIFQTFKELHKRRNLNINQFIKFLIAIQPISYKSIFKYL
ncbi:hypothetical protein, partial [Desulfonatronospira sp.]|uniref:hypothetical protein n=1 Tax=Desulfonatronospira sp. TaxID=1962951 RepID=UPI0025BB1D37